jgi:ElaB/YqjD/DUF883 family membrane-anchored ribosome-binding protein
MNAAPPKSGGANSRSLCIALARAGQIGVQGDDTSWLEAIMHDAQKNRLLNDLHAVVADAEALLRASAGDTSAAAGELRAKVQASLDRAKRNLSELQDAAVEKAKAAGRATDTYVHENPWQSIGIAAGVGLLLGVLVSRR